MHTIVCTDAPPPPILIRVPNSISDVIQWQQNTTACFSIIAYHIMWYPYDRYQLLLSATTNRTKFVLPSLYNNSTYVVEIVAETVDKTESIVHNASISVQLTTQGIVSLYDFVYCFSSCIVMCTNLLCIIINYIN